MRSDPPGRAVSEARRKVFSAALEQAEQLFGAAAGAGFASRPLPVFYGLSQAGRAIAAASTTADDANWRLHGHGITVPNLDRDPPSPLHELVVKDRGSGSFTQLAPLLRSGTLPDGAPLGRIWMTIPDLAPRPLTGVTDVTPALHLEMTGAAGGHSKVYGWLHAHPRPWTSSPTEEEIDNFLSHYLSLADHSSAGDGTMPVVDIAGGTKISRVWPWPADSDLNGLEGRLTQSYRGDDDRWVFPLIDGGSQPLHPLLAWWAVLFTLSMLARYEPSGWISHLDVNQSLDAVPLESALAAALDTCPLLILHAIREVAT
jgi:YaaC-like Protein